jgi:glycosyltransferase involved in cell wall biosynthesis
MNRWNQKKPTSELSVVHLCAVDFTVRQFIAPLALALIKEGYQVRCACSKGPHWEELAEMQVPMVEMPIARSMNPVKAFVSTWRLYRWLRREKPDVLHVHTPVASFIGRLAGFLAGVPTIIYTAHGFYFHDRMDKKQQRIHLALERFFGLLNHYLFCVSKEDARTAVKERIARKNRVFYIGNGADPTRFSKLGMTPDFRADVRSRYDLPSKATVVTIMGRLVREKGYFELFHAGLRLLERFPDLYFLVIGDTVSSEHDDAKDEILSLVGESALKDRVRFTGLCRDIPPLLHASDIFCLPTYREGMPVSILEAMMMELPVVTTRIRGCREEVVDGQTGFLVEPKNASEVEDSLAFLLSHPEIAQKMGKAGHQRALRSFDERKVLARQVKLYNRLLGDD